MFLKYVLKQNMKAFVKNFDLILECFKIDRFWGLDMSVQTIQRSTFWERVWRTPYFLPLEA